MTFNRLIIIYPLLAIYALALIFLQVTFLDSLASGLINVEISLILVIYAGFRMNVMRGGFLSYLLGFFFDTLAGTAPGMYGLLYVLIFALSLFVSREIDINTTPLLMLYVFACVMIKGVLLLGYYSLTADVVLWNDIWLTYLPQGVILAVISPLLFSLFRRSEVLSSDERQG